MSDYQSRIREQYYKLLNPTVYDVQVYKRLDGVIVLVIFELSIRYRTAFKREYSDEESLLGEVEEVCLLVAFNVGDWR